MSANRRGQVILRIFLLLNAGLAAAIALPSLVAAQPGHNLAIAASRELRIGGATLQVDFAAGPLDLSQDAIFDHVRAAASAASRAANQTPPLISKLTMAFSNCRRRRAVPPR